ncbi:MAG: ornithine carbamoyltransferase, partial [Gemmataceae bacterium]
MRHLLSLNDVNREEILGLLEQAARFKKAVNKRQRLDAMHGRVLGLVFEKPSLRTRVSFETAMCRLWGSSVFLQGQEAGLGTRESVPDFARTLSQYV